MLDCLTKAGVILNTTLTNKLKRLFNLENYARRWLKQPLRAPSSLSHLVPDVLQGLSRYVSTYPTGHDFLVNQSAD